MSEPPERHLLLLLHERLLNGDRVASEEVMGLMLAPLQEEIARRFRNVDEQLVSDGVIDAILDYCASPQRYNASSPLDRFLSKAAWRNVANLLKGESRRKQREWTVGRKNREADVALDPVARNILREEQEHCVERRAAILAALDDPRDREIATLILDGVRDSTQYALVLHTTDRQEVRRHKDRITRFLRRKGLLS
jgi:RNA polymerase sigma-70 factor (ECF subfamily)